MFPIPQKLELKATLLIRVNTIYHSRLAFYMRFTSTTIFFCVFINSSKIIIIYKGRLDKPNFYHY